MKYVLLMLIFTIGLLSNNNYELELYESLLPKLFQKESLTVYTKEAQQIDILKKSALLKIASNCSNADVILGKNFDDLPQQCLNKPIFATSYKSYINAENAFGAFYWSKGRPQIQFKLEVVQKYKLYFPDNLRKYAK